MTPEQLRKLWQEVLGTYSYEQLQALTDGNKVEFANKAVQLAALNSIVQNALDTFQPQG